MSTASAPSRFWGVVAIALNSVFQPAGEICGGTDSPALRLSPLFQIANAISLIYHSVRLSFAIGLPFRVALGVVTERAGLYHSRSGVTEPERHFYFRALVFVFGALPTAVKAFAIQGDWVSYLLVLGFFVPFLVLESIERLAKRPTRARRAEAKTMPKGKDDDVTVFSLTAALFALVFHVGLCLEMIKQALMKCMFEPKPVMTNMLIVPVSLLLYLYKLPPNDEGLPPVTIALFYASTTFFYLSAVATLYMWRHWSDIATTMLAIAVAITGTLPHLFVYLRLTSTSLHQLFSGENRHEEKFMEQWIALWTVICIFLYYGYLYDASGTYKPAWTEWLP